MSPGKNEEANLFTALQYGAYEVKFWICTTLESLKMLVTGQVGVDQLSGPVGIVDMVGNTYEQSKSYGLSVVIIELMNIAILLSANLGVMNLIPFRHWMAEDLCFCLLSDTRQTSAAG